jgi:hypothetical protein
MLSSNHVMQPLLAFSLEGAVRIAELQSIIAKINAIRPEADTRSERLEKTLLYGNKGRLLRLADSMEKYLNNITNNASSQQPFKAMHSMEKNVLTPMTDVFRDMENLIDRQMMWRTLVAAYVAHENLRQENKSSYRRLNSESTSDLQFQRKQ